MNTTKKRAVARYNDYYSLIFRGYGEDDKIKRANGEILKSFEEVNKSRDLFGVFREDIVMIDIDDIESSEIFMEILDELQIPYLYQETTRGAHVFFRKGVYYRDISNKTNTMLACGIFADIKCRATDGTKLMKDGESREILMSPYYEDDLVQIPPLALSIKESIDFLYMKEGDGRNSMLYNYILVLLRHGFTKEETRDCIRMINKHVMKEPFSDKEIATILRDEAFPTNNEVFIYASGKGKSEKLDYEAFCKKVISDYGIIGIDDVTYMKFGNVYRRITEKDLNRAIMSLLKNTTKGMRSEIIPYVEVYKEEKQLASSNLILFSNGVFDINKKEFVKNTGVFVNEIATDYIRDCKPQPLVDKFIDDIANGDKEVANLILEMVGYSLMRANPFQVFFILDGQGKNGKSALFDFITYCVGKDNVSNLSLHDFADRFGVPAIADKLINIGDDIPQDYIGDTSKIKKAVSGETFMGEDKGQDKVPIKYTGTLLFSGNGIPKFGDKSEGLARRLVTIPMKKVFKDGKDRDIHIMEKLCTKENAQYFIKLAVEALLKVLDRKGFTVSEQAEQAKEQFREDQNNVYEFYKLNKGTISGRKVKDVYIAYSVWCQESGYREIYSQRKFTAFMCNYAFRTKTKRFGNDREQIFELPTDED